MYATRNEAKADLFDYIEVFIIELNCLAILVLCLQMKIKIHIHRQVKCPKNWGWSSTNSVDIYYLETEVRFKKQVE